MSIEERKSATLRTIKDVAGRINQAEALLSRLKLEAADLGDVARALGATPEEIEEARCV